MIEIKVKKYGKIVTVKAIGIPWETGGLLYYRSGQMILGAFAVESIPLEKVVSVGGVVRGQNND